MKKAIVITLLLFLYIMLYKTYLTFRGEIAVYIINPLIWILLCTMTFFTLNNKKKKESKHQTEILPVITVITLLYVILYYSLGMISGYTNNPYSTVFSGIVINLFSVLLVACLKEYIRYTLLNVSIRRFKKTYYLILFFVFVLSDINFLNLIFSQNIIGVIAKEITIPIIINLFMMYLAYVSSYKGPIISRVIMLLPTLLFSVVPDYDWFIITAFNSLYYLILFLALQYVIDQKERSVILRINNPWHPRRWIVASFALLIIICFAAGFFPIKPVVILTESMKPLINPGDMPLIRKCDIGEVAIGDIIAYKINNNVVVHRVKAIYNNDGILNLITKGDANENADSTPVTSTQFIGKLQFSIPYVGYPTYVLRNIVYNNKEASLH